MGFEFLDDGLPLSACSWRMIDEGQVSLDSRHLVLRCLVVAVNDEDIFLWCFGRLGRRDLNRFSLKGKIQPFHDGFQTTNFPFLQS